MSSKYDHVNKSVLEVYSKIYQRISNVLSWQILILQTITLALHQTCKLNSTQIIIL